MAIWHGFAFGDAQHGVSDPEFHAGHSRASQYREPSVIFNSCQKLCEAKGIADSGDSINFSFHSCGILLQRIFLGILDYFSNAMRTVLHRMES
jgi:hypothetical protein